MLAYQNQFSERSSIHNHKLANRRVVTERTILVELNERILLRYVYLALADHSMLSPRMVTEEEARKTGGKSFLVQIYGEDVNFRFKKQVMFANKEDVDKLFQILKNTVGKERMRIVKYRINDPEPDDLNKAGMKMRAKWKVEWPL